MSKFDIIGDTAIISNRDNWVGIIGTRKPTREEINATKRLTEICVRENKVIVSGLALGIDACAHNIALSNGGTTVAILGTSQEEEIYPKQNKQLAENIESMNGGLIYPFRKPPTDNGPGFNQFMKRLIERDVLLASLCKIIVVVSDNKIISGGSRYTIHYGRKLGKDVFRYDSANLLHINPEYRECKINWNMELEYLDAYK